MSKENWNSGAVSVVRGRSEIHGLLVSIKLTHKTKYLKVPQKEYGYTQLLKCYKIFLISIIIGNNRIDKEINAKILPSSLAWNL